MNLSDIVSMRLQHQSLVRPFLKTPADVVSHLGAVQAQDYPAAKWAVGLRMIQATDKDIEKACDNGQILRTHIMRPTWHFVMPEDVHWMQQLTAPQVKKLMGHYNRKLELTDELFAKTNKIITIALTNNNYLTRQELKTILAEKGIVTDVQRLAHIVMWAELDALICNGPRRGKQFTYALLDERVPQQKELSRDESLAKLAKKYFFSHGPAQIKDFSWWSGLSMKDATEGISLIKSQLAEETFDGKTYWFFSNTKTTESISPTAYLLSIFDEYTIAYKDRRALVGQRYFEKLITMGNALTAVIVIDGMIVGTWKRAIKKNIVEITLNPFREFSSTEHTALEIAAKRYGAFVELPVSIS